MCTGAAAIGADGANPPCRFADKPLAAAFDGRDDIAFGLVGAGDVDRLGAPGVGEAVTVRVPVPLAGPAAGG